MPPALPPAQLPHPWLPKIGPITLRPLTLADNATAFVLSEVAFLPPDGEMEDAHLARQHRWADGARQWFGWLHAHAGAQAWAATCGEGGPLVGYARAIRDAATRREQLTELFVHPRFQGGQVGQALLAAVLPQAVPDGWGRVIIADPAFPALALYHRWGVYPLGMAWHARFALGQDEIEHAGHENPRKTRNEREDSALSGEHMEVIRFMQQRLQAHVQVSASGGYGVRCGAALGPVVGTDPDDALALVQALLASARVAGHHEANLWVPGANVMLLRWLRGRGPRWDGQVALLASDPALVARMDRSLLVASPYLW